MLHLKAAVESSSRPDLQDRLTGKFYTPEVLARTLVSSAPDEFAPQSICDPFCGDGRLIVAWIRHLNERGTLRNLNRVHLVDLDREAVDEAAKAVKGVLAENEAHSVQIFADAVDAFDASELATCDVVITNPPWEQLKPDSRDLVSESETYRSEIRAYSEGLAKKFEGSGSAQRRSVGGYTVNLARAGALLAASLVKEGGLLQIILPSTIFGDQVSTRFRENFFQKLLVERLDFYPAEARLFKKVDQSIVTLVGRRGGPTREFSLRRHGPDLQLSDERIHAIADAKEPLPLAVTGLQSEIVNFIRGMHPSTSWLESDLRFGLRLGREVDETRISECFTDSPNGIPFVKGRNIQRFTANLEDLPKLDPKKKKIPGSVFERRVVWRDVSRPSQKRRVHSCIIPPNYVAGNSLGIARFASQSSNLPDTWMAILNSLVFEIQIRAILSTNHVSQGAIRKCAVPYKLFEDEALRSKIAGLAKQPSIDQCIAMEVAVAKGYGLGRADFEAILTAFNKFSEEEKCAYLKKEIWS
ncbi:N-6 DNA methylase [Sphingomicrobium sp. XHP0235]|uniref:N-6 DNA methylase n=1 Tax=Sphingomicrobium aquimarinum TaxID=3133971 RepID=UPI0031FEED0F